MIELNDSNIKTLMDKSDIDYFWPEYISFYSEHLLTCEDNDFIEKRKLGENDDYLAKLIRDDSIEEFKIYVNRNNISFYSKIKRSSFETNSFLVTSQDKIEPTLIEYAAFYGSIQIFRYLQIQNVELTPSLWIYGIHSNNIDILYLLEESNIEPKDLTYNECLIESIKCHHEDITNYFLKTKEFILL